MVDLRAGYKPFQLVSVAGLACNTDKHSWSITFIDDVAKLEVWAKARITINYFQFATHPIFKVCAALGHEAVDRIIDSHVD